MSVTVKRTLSSATLTEEGFGAVVEYAVHGAENEYDAIHASGIPVYGALYDGAVGSGVWITARAANIRAELAQGSDSALNWKVTVTYSPQKAGGGGGSGRPDNPESGDEYWELDGQGERSHVENCLDQTGYPEEAPEVGLAVGVNEDNEIAGADIQERAMVLRVHRFFTPEDVDGDYLKDLRAELTKVNSAEWYGFAAGEVYFDSFKTTNQNQDLVEVVFTFLIRQNIGSGDLPEFEDKEGEAIAIAGGKKGWEYLWAMPGRQIDETGSGGLPKQKHYYKGVWVSQFYDLSTFAALGLSGELWGS